MSDSNNKVKVEKYNNCKTCGGYKWHHLCNDDDPCGKEDPDSCPDGSYPCSECNGGDDW